MHDRAKNFCSYLAGVYDTFVTEPNANTENEDIIKTSEFIKNYLLKEPDFKNFQFGYLGLLCNNPNGRIIMGGLRELDQDEQKRKEIITRLRNLAAHAKNTIEKIEQTPDEDLHAIIIKLSLYFNLFTKMYFE